MGTLTKAVDFLAQVVGLEAGSQQTAAQRYQAMVREIATGQAKGTPAKALEVATAAGKTAADLQADVAARQRINASVVAVGTFSALAKARDQAKARLVVRRQERAAALAELAKAEVEDARALAAASSAVVGPAQNAQTILHEGGVGAALLELSEACARARVLEGETRQAEQGLHQAEKSLAVAKRQGAAEGVLKEVEADRKGALDDLTETRASHAKAKAEAQALRAKLRDAIRAVHGLEGEEVETLLAGFEPVAELNPAAPGPDTWKGARWPSWKVAKAVGFLNQAHVLLVGRR